MNFRDLRSPASAVGLRCASGTWGRNPGWATPTPASGCGACFRRRPLLVLGCAVGSAGAGVLPVACGRNMEGRGWNLSWGNYPWTSGRKNVRAVAAPREIRGATASHVAHRREFHVQRDGRSVLRGEMMGSSSGELPSCLRRNALAQKVPGRGERPGVPPRSYRPRRIRALPNGAAFRIASCPDPAPFSDTIRRRRRAKFRSA